MPGADSGLTPPLSPVTPPVARWGVQQHAPDSRNTVMRILIIYDIVGCAHRGFQGLEAFNGDQNLQILVWILTAH